MRSIIFLLSLICATTLRAQSLSAYINSPLCLGETLRLSIPGAATNTYLWTGPNGFSSTLQSPTRSNMSYADTGVYTVVINGTTTYFTQSVKLNPAITLTGVTANQQIPYGGSIQLNAWGAVFYYWSPDDKSLSNPNTNNPVATPLNSTIYKVVGMSEWGCRDSAEVKIDIAAPDTFFIPSAFTPNNDGLNDEFRIVNTHNYKLVHFAVQNRWGQLVYENTVDIRRGWDGTYKGIPQDIGNYSYHIIVATPAGDKRIFTGNVVLVR